MFLPVLKSIELKGEFLLRFFLENRKNIQKILAFDMSTR
ncbi:hypothetical protein SAMN04487861_11124 [Selenomonas ruminantium]|uniref:Uncharacterized protein n=1 Tax=Selenomonas ruminantium TaxID=971 RepID=A0A1I3EPL5_SELRU|nr:hypothetical protein SAMN04487861_11124 [Selenomonas ruminantium]